MSHIEKMLKEKESLILDITNQLISWDGTVEHATRLLGENDARFHQLTLLDQEIPDGDLKAFNEKYRNHWQKLINTQQELMQSIQVGQADNQELLAQIDNKEKVVKNYMSVKNKSIFIEKDY